ncbi:hypothetical protein LTS10_006111 [Elasticomyces elasticus]|nr:hypothetical protein LTS10_006111 [Elasticomyces elasticus]
MAMYQRGPAQRCFGSSAFLCRRHVEIKELQRKLDLSNSNRAILAEETIRRKLEEMQHAPRSEKLTTRGQSSQRLSHDIEYEAADLRFWRAFSEALIALQKVVNAGRTHHSTIPFIKVAIPILRHANDCDNRAGAIKRRGFLPTVCAPISTISLGARIARLMTFAGRAMLHFTFQFVARQVLWASHKLIELSERD